MAGSSTPIFHFTEGRTPLLISVPHAGTELPDGFTDGLTAEARALPDTDWFVDQLYGFATELGAGMLVARHSRFVIDLNRPPGGESLYPGQATTGLCPTSLFDGSPVYRPGCEPDDADIARRVETYWRPYHECLQAEIDNIRSRHGYAILYDAHSIASVVPRLFDGHLPDLNLGTVSGTSAAPGLIDAVKSVIDQASFTSVVNGRFVGGYITRAHGRPADAVHGLQMELGLDAYMDAGVTAFDRERAAPLQAVLRHIVDAMLDWRPS